MSISPSVVAFGDVMQALAQTAADMVIAARDEGIEECIAILRPALMQDENPDLALTASRWIEQMRKLKRAP